MHMTGFRRRSLVAGLVVTAALLGACSGSSNGQGTQMMVDGSGAKLDSVSDLAKTAQIVFSGRVTRVGDIARISPPPQEVKGDESPEVFAYAMVDVRVDEILATRDGSADLAAKLGAAPSGFAIIDPALKGVSNGEQLKEEYRTSSEVPKRNDEGIFFAAYHNLGSAGDGFEILGFASSKDKRTAKFDSGIKGDLAGSSKDYDQIVATSKDELKKPKEQ